MEILPIIIFAIIWFFTVKFCKKKGYKAVIRHLLGFVMGVLGLVIAIIAITPSPEVDKNTIDETVQHQTVLENEKEIQSIKIEEPIEEPKKTDIDIQPKQKTLELNINEFSTRVNKALKNAQSPFKITRTINVDEGSVNDTAKYMFSDNFGIIITLEKGTHKVKSLMTIITPSPNNSDENLVMLFSNAAVLSAFEGENEIKTLGKKIMDMTTSAMTEYSSTKKDISKKFVFNGKEYGISVSSYTGIMSFANFED